MEQSLRILFVEDNLSDAELIWRHLKREKIIFTKELVYTCDAYLASLSSFHPNLIISDFSLPQFDGMQALLLRNDLAPDIPFILVTGSINEEVAVKCMKSGADDYILKDSLSRLGEAVKSAIKKKEVVDQKETAERLLRESLEAIKRSQREFQNYFESGAIGMSVTGPDKKWIQVNEKLCHMFGFTREELLGKTWMDITHPDDLAENNSLFTEAILGNIDKYELEKRFLRKDGKVIDIYLSVVCQRNEDGSIHHFLSSYIDMTERKSFEEQIEHQRIMLRTLIDNLPSPVYILDNEGRKVIANKADLRNIGIENESDAIGKTDLELFPGEIGKRGHLDNLQIINSGSTIIDREEVFYNKHGEKTYLLTSKVPLFDINKKISGLVGIGYDITERKMMEEKIHESETYYRTLVDLSPDGIFICNYEGIITYSSKKIADIFKLPEGSNNILDSSILEWVSPDFHETVVGRMKDILSGNINPEIREYKLLRYDRTPFWAELSSSPITYKNMGLLVVCRDITQRKNVADELLIAKEKAEESDRLKTAFLHNISHEIRTPMNAIVGFSELLTGTELDMPTVFSYVDVIRNSSNHLLSILNDIIDIANIEANIVRIHRDSLNLKSMLNNMNNQFMIKAVEKKLDLKLECELSLKESTIITDSTKLQQVISNLLSNAIKFTTTGGITFGCKRKENVIEFFVKDTGIGIPPEHQKRIFDRFFQVENPVSKVYEGTGLGLAISRAYVELLGGEIYLLSIPGKGTEFYFTIPFEKPFTSEITDHKSIRSSEFSFSERKTILVAEDIDSNYKLIQYFLKGINADIIRASNGREAVELAFSSDKIDLILMDVKMPEMDGFTAIGKIREFRPDIPIITQTAYSDDADKALASGSSAFIAKPFDKKRLIDLIEKLI
jgi:PAS domain S-box-containing protein